MSFLRILVLTERLYDVIGIDENVFSYNDKITDVSFPNCIQTIKQWAFAGIQIKKINLPSSLHYLGASTFTGLLLEEIQIPSSVKTIEPFYFFDCGLLSEVF